MEYTNISKCFGGSLATRILNGVCPGGFSNFKSLDQSLELIIENVENYGDIFLDIKSDEDFELDRIIEDRIAEVRLALKLVKNGYDNICKIPTPKKNGKKINDFVAFKDGEECFFEVRRLTGEDFKEMEKEDGGFLVTYDKLIRQIKLMIEKKRSQFEGKGEEFCVFAIIIDRVEAIDFFLQDKERFLHDQCKKNNWGGNIWMIDYSEKLCKSEDFLRPNE